MSKRPILNLVLVLASIAVGLLVFEAGLRLAGIVYPCHFYVLDKYTGSAQRAGAQGWHRMEHKTFIRINSDGLRDREHSKEKPANTIRIAVLGDSYAQALQVPMEKAFWSVMEREMSHCPYLRGRSVEVINFGVSGYSTAQELLTLRHRAWEYSPDIVMLTVTTGNDISGNCRSLRRTPNMPYFVRRDGKLVLDQSFRQWQRPRRIYYWMINRFRVFQLIHQVRSVVKEMRLAEKARVKKKVGEIGIDTEVYSEPTSPVWKSAWQTTEDLIVMMRDEVAAKGAAFCVVTLSNPIQVHPDPEVRRQAMDQLGVSNLFYPDLRLQALGEREGIHVLVLAPAMKDYAEESGTFLHGFGEKAGGGHWNEKGHQLAGELIAHDLCETFLKDH
jgi:hypothetical protein